MYILHIEKCKKRIRKAVFACIVVALMGVVTAYVVGNRASHAEEGRLLLQADTIARTLTATDVAGLSGSPYDLNDERYQRIKRTLTDSISTRPDLRFIYLMGHRREEGFDRASGDKLYFMVDSEDPTSKDYSAPGDVYNKTSQGLLDAFETGDEYVEAMFKDEWGTWVSVFVPIINPATGKIVALLGTDTDASDWSDIIWIKRLVPLSIFFLIILMLLVYIYATKRLITVYEKLIEKEKQRREDADNAKMQYNNEGNDTFKAI